MQSIHKTRFIAANYSNLQGLKAVPLGLLLLFVVLWANSQTGKATNLSLPILFSLVMAVITWTVYRYYRIRFGKIDYSPRQKRVEMILGIVGGAIALGAFLADTALKIPVSLTGLVFAGAILAEYLRMQWYAPGRDLLPVTMVCFLIMLATSILPILGAGEWWTYLGMRAQLFGVLIVAGAMIVCYGLIWHWYFISQLPGSER